MIRNCNDQSGRAPYLRFDINIWNLNDLPQDSKGPVGLSESEQYSRIKEAGYTGVQDGDPVLCRESGLRYTGQHRVNEVGDIDEIILKWTDEGYDCSTIHLGWGIEDDFKSTKLVEYILGISQKFNFPIYIETHRATLTQDMWRTVQLVEKFPEMRFNGDFSHWYTGLEMVNGGMESKLEFIEPVLDRVRFIHGRIGNPGCIQVPVDQKDTTPYIEDFKMMWKKSFNGFLRSTVPGDYICFTPELLSTEYFYAQLIPRGSTQVEVSDRWTQSLILCQIARECWEAVNKETSL